MTDTQTQTDATKRITTPHSVVIETDEREKVPKYVKALPGPHKTRH